MVVEVGQAKLKVMTSEIKKQGGREVCNGDGTGVSVARSEDLFPLRMKGRDRKGRME